MATDRDAVPRATVRRATADDLPEITRIYDQYIVDSHISFDTEPWSVERRWQWWLDHQGHDRLVVLVATIAGGRRHGGGGDDGETVVGAAYSSWYRPKTGYQRTVETSIVLDRDRVGAGIGTTLYGALLDDLAAAGTHRAYAVVALPNDPSVALHHRLGFTDVGVEHECGYKLGRYWSTLTLEKRFD